MAPHMPSAPGDHVVRRSLRRFDVDQIVETGLDLLRELAELRPLLAELGRVMRGCELLGIGPLHVVHHVAAILAAMQADRDEAWLLRHETSTLRHQFEHLGFVIGWKLDDGELGYD